MGEKERGGRVKADRELPNRQGRLKIFFGYASGVGKTRAMLYAAAAAMASGLDVQAGFLCPGADEQEQALAKRFPVIQCTRVRGCEELNLDAALRLRPDILLIDRLAHKNAPGCRHRHRYQDVQELLRAGIDVWSTLNVGELESLYDIAGAVSGGAAAERVPDSMFDSAAEIQLVDAPLPDCEPDREEGLCALREMALRRAADHIGRTALPPRPGVLPAGEHVMICLSSSPSNARVIRAAARMAGAFHSGFTALYVETPQMRSMSGADAARLSKNRKLAEDLGAHITTVYGEDIVAQIAEYARVSGVSKIVLGRSNSRGIWPRRSIVDRLTRLAPSLDIYIIPDSSPPYRPRRGIKAGEIRLSGADALRTAIVLVLVSAAGLLLDSAGLGDTNVVTVYILGVLVTAVWTGERIWSVLVSLISVMLFNFLFTEPRFTLSARAVGYHLTFVIMLAAGLITSSLTGRIKKQARQTARKAYRTEVLLETSQKLQKAGSRKDIVTVSAEQMVKLLGRTVLFYLNEGGELSDVQVFRAPGDSLASDGAEERRIAQWVLQNNKHAGATTNTFPEAKHLYMAVRGQGTVPAVVGIAIEGEMETFEKSMLIALLGECGLALEKAALDAEKQRMALRARQEELRANLLRTISHDLRTPLTAISGSAGILMSSASALGEEKKAQLYTAIYDDAMWLIRLVENLLSVTRIENGSMDIRMEAELFEEVFQEAMQHLDRRAAEHSISVRLEEEFLMARMDARLIVQVVINMLNNAVKYTPPGSHITLSARRQGDKAIVEVADDGPGIRADSREKLFDMFYTEDNTRGDGRRGLGLGLSLCRSIIMAHGGQIGVRENTPHGAIFYFSLDAVEENAHE